jgi:SAM-dependent methyltransferase
MSERTVRKRKPWDRTTYVIDAEDAAELVRAMRLERLVAEHMGEPFPERETDLVGEVRTILDVACGPGGWVLSVAYRYPKVKVIGIDINPTIVEYARAQAWSQGLENAEFRVMDALKPLDFPDDAFDLVNARFLSTMMPVTAWPPLLRECRRVTRSGGVLRLTEAELSMTSSPALEELSSLLGRALLRKGYSFSPTGRTLGIAHMLGPLLRGAGWQDIGYRPFVIDFSAGTPAQGECYQQVMVTYRLLQDFICEYAPLAPEDFERLYQQALGELLLDDFGGLWFYLLAWGTNP